MQAGYLDYTMGIQANLILRQVDRFDKTEPAYSISVEGLGIDFEKE